MFVRRPCCCPPARGEGMIVTDNIGDGHLLLIGDSNVFFAGPTAPQYMPYNGDWWNNVADWIGPGAVGCFGTVSGNYTYMPSSIKPTVANVDASKLPDVVAIFTGYVDPGCGGGAQLIPTTFLADLKAWIEAGGILMVAGEWQDVANNSYCLAESYRQNFNAVLSAMGSPCVYRQRNIDIGPTVWSATLPGHELTDGTFGTPLTTIKYSATNTIANGYVVALPHSGV